MSEALITKQFKDHLDDKVRLYGRSFMYWKISDRYASGRPDFKVMFMGESAYIELKAEGEKPRPRQTHEMRKLQQAGFIAVWFDNASAACQFVDDLVSKRLKKTTRLAR